MSVHNVRKIGTLCTVRRHLYLDLFLYTATGQAGPPGAPKAPGEPR